MLSFLLRRTIHTIFVVFIVTIISFLLLHIIPGDPVVRILGAHATAAQIEQLRHELGLDQPILWQYIHWIWNVFHGDFGKSFIYHEDVGSLMLERFPVTLYLVSISLILSTIIGIIGGVISAVKRGGVADSLISLFANTGIAIPSFWLGIVGIYIFGLKLGWLPVQGYTSPFGDLWMSLKQLIMPVFATSVPNVAIVARQTRSSMLETIQQDYVRTAKSKGLKQRVVLYKHALRNALIPVVTLVGLTLAFLIGGEFIIETICNIPGVGRLLVRAAMNKDYLIVQGGVLILGTAICIINLVVDVTYGLIDPRIRYK
ncbi:MAG: peptide ABC transporter [Phycisphaerae bacterium SM23_30]|nr:MAG: peptide ABC transporter [Phycisphaerae bacterium SM23_30]